MLRHFYTEVVGPCWPAERHHVETGYRTLTFPFSELEAPPLAMIEHWTLPQLLGYVRTWSATQRFRETMGHDPVEQLGHSLSQYWGSPSSLRTIRWPLTVRFGRCPG